MKLFGYSGNPFIVIGYRHYLLHTDCKTEKKTLRPTNEIDVIAWYKLELCEKRAGGKCKDKKPVVYITKDKKILPDANQWDFRNYLPPDEAATITN